MSLRREERLGNFFSDFRWTTRALILHSDYKEPIDEIGFDTDDTVAFNGIGSIAGQVLEHLTKQSLIEPNFRARRHQLHFNSDVGNFEILIQLSNDAIHPAAFQVWLRESGEL